MLMADGSRQIPLDAAQISLAVLAFAVFLISIVSTCNSLLNAYGKPQLPFLAVLVGLPYPKSLCCIVLWASTAHR